MCEVISCGDAHPRVSGGWLLLTGLAVVTAGETEGAEHGSVVELGEAWQATGKVVRRAGVRIGRWQAGTLREGPWRQGALILHGQFLLYQVSQSLPGDVKRIKTQVIILLFTG